jgi:hypothetical protein
MKKVFPVILLLFTSCTGMSSSLQTYQVGEYSINLASSSKVNSEYQKVCSLNCSRSVKGFVNYRNKEMWSIQSMPVVMHEIKHIVEGHYHAKTISMEKN